MSLYLFSVGAGGGVGGTCVDSGLENVANREAMKTGGWNVDGCPDESYASYCNNPNTFWCYDYGSAVGYVEATFSGSGKATLDYGNCFSGVTKVYLNDVEIDTVNGQKSKIITFDYNCGDTLKLTEEGSSILKINSLNLAECSECGEDKNGRLYIEFK